MKTILKLQILLVFLTLNAHILYAGNHKGQTEPSGFISVSRNIEFKVPLLADFNDNVPEKSPSFLQVAPPGVPKEATFEENSDDDNFSFEELRTFAPTTPAEADFEDESSESQSDNTRLNPSIPWEAGFDEVQN